MSFVPDNLEFLDIKGLRNNVNDYRNFPYFFVSLLLFFFSFFLYIVFLYNIIVLILISAIK